MKSLDEIKDEIAEDYYARTKYVPTEWAVMNFHGGFTAGVKAAQDRAQALVEILGLYTNDDRVLDALSDYKKSMEMK